MRDDAKEPQWRPIDLTRETFEDTVTRERHHPGRLVGRVVRSVPSFAPVYEAASERHPDVTFATIDTEAEPELAAARRRSGAIPTLMAFRDGVLVFSQAGALPGEALELVIQAVRDVDMEDVRRQLADAERLNQPEDHGVGQQPAAPGQDHAAVRRRCGIEQPLVRESRASVASTS